MMLTFVMQCAVAVFLVMTGSYVYGQGMIVRTSSSSSSGGTWGTTFTSRSSNTRGNGGFAASSHISKVTTGSSPSSGRSTPDEDPMKGFRVVCIFNNKHYYWQEFTPSMIDPSLCTHINYEFAILDPKTYEMIMGEPDLDIDFYDGVIALKTEYPKLKVLLSVGGWEDSTKKYSEMAAVEARRGRFIKAAVDFLKKHEFDGLDVAWEYPNCWQGAIGVNPSDKDNFSALMKELKEAFKEENLLLTASVGAIKREIEAAYNVTELSENVDFLNVMTYDLHGPWEPKTGHHTQFNSLPGDEDPDCNVKSAMDIWVKMGADKKKLNMGLAMYAKTFQLDDPRKTGLGAPARGVGMGAPGRPGGFLLYNEICKYLNNQTCTEQEHKMAGFFAVCGDSWACYDPPLMIVRKAKYIVEEGFGGALIKDVSCDDFEGSCFGMKFPLIRMTRMEIQQRARRMQRKQGG